MEERVVVKEANEHIYLEVPEFVQTQHTSKEDDSSIDSSSDDIFDSPRLFIELMCLSEEDDREVLWRESARWVRFEEDVEEGGNRWSKPHVSTLSVRSLFETRCCIFNGVLILDHKASTLEDIIDKALDQLVQENKVHFNDTSKVRGILRKPSSHQNFHMNKKSSIANLQKLLKVSSKADIHEDIASAEENNSTTYKSNRHFMKKIPEGSEAANVLIGEVSFLENILCSFIRLENPILLESFTEVSVASRFIFFLLCPIGQLEKYFEVGRCISTLFSDEIFREVAYKSLSMEHITAGIDEFLDAAALLPPGEWDPQTRIEPPEVVPTKATRKNGNTLDKINEEEEQRFRAETGLVRTGRLFGGLVDDVKRKLPWYLSDFKDAFALQSVASFFFIYFACLTPIVAFGGLLGEATGNNIAVMESLVSALICGVIYGLFSGQPLTIIGSTGPVLVFETILYDFCIQSEWNYLSIRMWIGLWTAVILMVLVAFDASAFVCYITRFTEENFACLIAFIFIFEAIEKVEKIAITYPMDTKTNEIKNCNCTWNDVNNGSKSVLFKVGNFSNGKLDTLEECLTLNGTIAGNDCGEHYPDIFLLSVLLFFGTFIISNNLKAFRTTPFLPSKVRSFISDFAVIIAIVMMSLLDYLIGIHTPKLQVPETFNPTISDRGWIVAPFNGNPWWTPAIAVIPAFLLCILIFMDQQITSVIVNRREHKLLKGGGYHLDLFVLSILIGITSVMGLPWFVAATVLSINHVNSLKKETECSAPGEKAQFLGVRENRVTSVLIFLCVGLSVLITPILCHIPMPVLFGVFLYMGIAALKDIQFFERILIMLMPLKYQPDRTYLRTVPLRKIHLFTGIQLTCLVVLWLIKHFKETSILFPLMLVIMLGIRKLLGRIFTDKELKILDDVLPEFKRIKKINEDEGSIDEEKTIESLTETKLEKISHVYENGNYPSKDMLKGGMLQDRIKKLNLDNRLNLETASVRHRRRNPILEPVFSSYRKQKNGPENTFQSNENKCNRIAITSALSEEKSENIQNKCSRNW